MGIDFKIKKEKLKASYYIALAYLAFQLLEYVFTNFIAHATYNTTILHIAVFCLLFILALPNTFCFVNGYEVKEQHFRIDEKKTRAAVFIISALAIIALLIALYIFFPDRRMNHDVDGQFYQARIMKFSDWHPALQTILAIALPMKIFKTEVAVYIVQAIGFGLAFGYMCETIFSVSKNLYLLIVPYYVILVSPYTLRLATFPQKDTSFAIVGIIAMTALAKIYYSKGEWLKKWYNMALLICCIVLLSIFRHNGILFTIPFMVVLFFNANKKRAALVTVLSIALFLIIKGPVYSAINVIQPGYRVTETTGLLMNIIASTMQSTPEAVSDETRRIAYSILPQEMWNNYTMGDFNRLKFSMDSWKVFENAGPENIIKATLDCLIKSPKAAMAGFFRTTDFVYGLNATYEGLMMYVMILFGPGLLSLLTVYVILARLDFKNKDTRLRAANCLPTIIYTVLTMLLLTGNLDSKLFYLTQCTIPILIFMSLISREKETGNV